MALFQVARRVVQNELALLSDFREVWQQLGRVRTMQREAIGANITINGESSRARARRRRAS